MNRKSEIARLEQELAALKQAEATAEANRRRQMVAKDEAELAELLHENMCHANHTDGCGWGYEGDNWERGAHGQYLTKARRLLKLMPLAKLKPVIAAMFQIEEWR